MKVSTPNRWILALFAGFLASLIAYIVAHIVVWLFIFNDSERDKWVIGKWIFSLLIALLTGVMVAPLHGKRFLIIVASLFIFSCLFSPWKYTPSHRPAGYALLFNPPRTSSWTGGEQVGVQTDFGRLFLEWAALATVTGMAWMLVIKPARSHDDKANQTPTPTSNPEE